MTDTVQYTIDYLPKFVDIEFDGGIKGVYGLKIQFNGTKGFSIGYWLDTDYGTADIIADPEIWKSVYEQLEKRFGEGPCPSNLVGADYIRSDQQFRSVIQLCYRFLRKHKLCKARQHNIRAKKKLFISPVY